MSIKTNIFYVDEKSLLEAISAYGKGPNTKDYEYAISVHTKRLFEKKYKKPFTITFELNNKQHAYTRNFNPTPSETIQILRTLLKEDTPVDFGLAPVVPGNLEGFAYPFQVKKFIGKSIENFVTDLAAFINMKANSYRADDVSLIIVPQVPSDPDSPESIDTGVPIKDLMHQLHINEKALRTVLIFEYLNDRPRLIQIWPVYGTYS